MRAFSKVDPVISSGESLLAFMYCAMLSMYAPLRKKVSSASRAALFNLAKAFKGLSSLVFPITPPENGLVFIALIPVTELYFPPP